MSDHRKIIQSAADAHSNLVLWAAVAELLSNNLVHQIRHAPADRVLRISVIERAKYLREYDKHVTELERYL